jgi:hypothetical protein
MNAAFVLVGLLTAAGAILTCGQQPRCRMATVGAALVAADAGGVLGGLRSRRSCLAPRRLYGQRRCRPQRPGRPHRGRPLNHAQADPAVVNQQPVSGPGVAGQPFIGGRYPVVGSCDVINGDPDLLTRAPLDRTGGEAAQPDFGPYRSARIPTVRPVSEAAWQTPRYICSWSLPSP